MSSVDTVLTTYAVDLAHARQVADHALALFDALAPAADLPDSARHLVELGALLHNVGLTTDPPAHHLVGRDIVLRHVLTDLTLREQALIAAIVAFHRKKVRPDIEPAYISLGKKQRHLALQLAALVRVADGLDYHQRQTTSIAASTVQRKQVTLTLRGPFAASDGERAVAKADLFARVFGRTLVVQVDADAPAADVVPAAADTNEQASLAPWYAHPAAPLAELGRVLLRRHFRRMLQAERDVRADKEIEAIHALRVATRRLRAILRLLAPVADPQELRRFSRAEQQVARVAGAVRDRDVLLVHLRATKLPDDTQQAELVQVGEQVAAARRAAHAQLIALLDSAAHAAFQRNFATFMNSSAHWNDSIRVRDIAGSTLWQHYEALRAYDRDGLPAAIEDLHAMRIEGKRLRYVLELFTDTFGERVTAVVTPLVAFQDHLGVLNDTDVAASILASDAPAAAAACVAAYLAVRSVEGERLIAELPARWEKIASATYRRRLLDLIVKL
jgi:CHAD domain-containing protein